ncbi:MAG: NUDIX hydrolase [Thermomicrobium sp.]
MAGTTDPQEELFDVLTSEGERTGLTVTRGLAHRLGLWHPAFHLWIGWHEGEEIFILLQRRSLTKDTMAGRIDVSVGGHFRAGEYDPQRLRQGVDREPVLRELCEELGLQAEPEGICWVGTRWSEHREHGRHDREIQEIFLWLPPVPPQHFSPDPQEVAQVLAVPLPVLADLLTGARPSAAARVLWEGTGTMRGGTETTMTLTDLVPGRREYWRAMLKVIESAALGRPLPILTLRRSRVGAG